MSHPRQKVFYPKTETELPDKELIGLRRRYDRFDKDAELRRICKFIFNQEPISYKKIVAWGLDHLLYDVRLPDRRIVIRINNTSVGDHYFEVEHLVYQTLIKKKIQSCKVHAVEKRGRHFPYDFIILDRLLVGDLEALLEKGYYSKKQEVGLVVKSGALLRKIHRIPTKNYGFFDPGAADKGKFVGIKHSWEDYLFTALKENVGSMVKLGYISSKKARDISKAMAGYKNFLQDVKPVLLHGDYCDHNIIVSGERITGVIDWTDCMSGDYLHDIAFWASFYPKERLDIFLKGYFANKPFPKNFYRKLNLYLLRINLSKAVLRYKYGIAERVPLAIEKIEESLKFLKPR